jgi:23S rRNA (cytosine1962-C5)-methyltransferase
MPGTVFGRVTLRKDLTRSILAGHPWIYRDALKGERAIPDGAVVLVISRAGKPIGRGFWSSTSPIAVRMLVTDATVEIDVEIRRRLRAALERRLAFLELASTNTFRWVHGEADALPGMHLDVYGACASVRFDGVDAATFYQPFGNDILSLGGVLGLQSLVQRRRGARSGPAAAPPQPAVERAEGDFCEGEGCGDSDGDALKVLAGIAPGDEERVVRENGLAFEVDVRHGQKGGLFLDQRDNRQRVRQMSMGRSVLNLFGYTGGFSVCAAAGGARQTTTVDLAAGAIAAARRNFERNHLALGEQTQLLTADAFAYLASARQRGQSWELLISDPPSFAPSRRALPEALSAYRRLHRLCASVTVPGGVLCAASCSSHVTAPGFIETVVSGCADAGRRFEVQEVRGAGADHPVIPQFPEGDYLKFIVGIIH